MPRTCYRYQIQEMIQNDYVIWSMMLYFVWDNETTHGTMLSSIFQPQNNQMKQGVEFLTSLSNGNRILSERIESAGLDVDSTLNPVRWDGPIADADVATKGEQAGMLLSLFIPFVLAIWTASAAVQPSIDMTVGERERGTLNTSQPPIIEIRIATWKWLAVVSITAVGVTLQITGLLFGIAYLASDFIDVPSLSIFAILLLALAVAFYGTMVIALSCARHALNRSKKQVQSYQHAAIYAYSVNPLSI